MGLISIDDFSSRWTCFQLLVAIVGLNSG